MGQPKVLSFPAMEAEFAIQGVRYVAALPEWERTGPVGLWCGFLAIDDGEVVMGREVCREGGPRRGKAVLAALVGKLARTAHEL